VFSYVGYHGKQAAHVLGYQQTIAQLVFVQDLHSGIKANWKTDHDPSSFRLHSLTLGLMTDCITGMVSFA
jgi:hypothetical protein